MVTALTQQCAKMLRSEWLKRLGLQTNSQYHLTVFLVRRVHVFIDYYQTEKPTYPK